ncbi:DUF3168 domain-containing protein [Gemmobacter lutimaris]|uniref:DUF3168 domain-containing protein n=1 Tax=Gemmobacter lutimaris TaxID=2306023 RepID=A0A398BPS3_9RHOB|nr:DUF3168 domain-containing protein [Gemmobacter lutimaris]RID91547.1 DUF3168 domain-containing protein [Gemmobacter lutimaris]
MSVSEGLQAVLRDRLVSDTAVSSFVGERVLDEPKAPVTFPYITFGPSDVTPDDADCIAARIETQQIDVWSNADDGKAEAKRICDAVRKALHGFSAEMSDGALVESYVTLVRVMGDPEEGISHGVLTVECTVEE